MLKREVFDIHDYHLDFYVDYPEGFCEDQTYPVIFYFHGMGGVRQGLDYMIQTCVLRREYIPTDIPGGVEPLIVVPSCPDVMWFSHFDEVVSFVKSIIGRSYVDASRIYITGSSMGGYTCWMLSVLYPELFAAAAICCGGGTYFHAHNIDFPVRAYHGKEDTCVLPRESEIMVQSMKNAGRDATLFLYDGVAHNVWDIAYQTPDTYHWMLAQKRERA